MVAGGAGAARGRDRPRFCRSRATTTNPRAASIERGLEADLLLLSGGVSAGKYDIVERVLADLGARFFFDRVQIQPGQPLVFGAVRGKFFFGLPGNPASTMVTFELFARAAIERLERSAESLRCRCCARRLTSRFPSQAGSDAFSAGAI